MLRLFMFLMIIGIISACGSLGPTAIGDAAEELTYLAPGDQLEFNDGTVVYVDEQGILRGIPEISPIAAGRKIRDVMQEIAVIHPEIEQYWFTQYGERYIDVAGVIPRPGKYALPPNEDWSMMNLLMNIDAIQEASENREFLLVRKSWQFSGSNMFLRGEALPELSSIGGDDLLIHSGDRVLFPGNKFPIYVFGAAVQSVCFTYTKDSPPNLLNAIEQAGGLSEQAKKNYVHIYRVLRTKQPTIITVAWPMEQNFKLEPWDVIYIP